jgi:hypothetical protein
MSFGSTPVSSEIRAGLFLPCRDLISFVTSADFGCQLRYGSIFKTSLVGHPVGGQELNYGLVFQQEQGGAGRHVQVLYLKESMFRDVEHAVSSALCTWSTLPDVELKETVSTVRHCRHRHHSVSPH